MHLGFVVVNAERLDADLAGDHERLGAALGAVVVEWPPIGGEWDDDARHHFRSLVDDVSFDERIGPFYVVRHGVLVASAGFFGPPDATSAVEIGYSVCQCARRQGVATAIVAELVRRAAELRCASVTARVRPDNTGSLVVLDRSGFVPAGELDDGLVLLTRTVCS